MRQVDEITDPAVHTIAAGSFRSEVADRPTCRHAEAPSLPTQLLHDRPICRHFLDWHR